MQKKRVAVIAIAFFFVSFCIGVIYTPTYAANSWGDRGSTPIKILDKVKDKANNNKGYEIQDTALDDSMSNVSKNNGKIYGTLDAVRKNIHVYLQWMMYIGLSVATIILIYNGFLLVTNGVHKSGDLSTVKKNISKVIIGVFIMTAFWLIVKLILALINVLFAQS